MAPRRRSELAALVGHLLLATLAVCWLLMSGLKVVKFYSEPTASGTWWEKSDRLPVFSVCPSYRTSKEKVDSLLASGANLSLVQLFRRAGLSPGDMIRGLKVDDGTEYGTEYGDGENYHMTGKWTDGMGLSFEPSIDYIWGGICATTAEELASAEIDLLRNPDYEYTVENTFSYDMIFHGSHYFWGDGYTEDGAIYFSPQTKGQELVVTANREVRENTRQNPCNEDPNYSIRLCHRQCYFAWLNCSLTEDTSAEKPRCKASDFNWYILQDGFNPHGTFTYAPDGLDACPCQAPCTAEYYSISTRPYVFATAENVSVTRLNITPDRVKKVLHTYVTYKFTDLLADVGGYLGLLLGSSLLSVCQVLPRLVSWAQRRYQKRVPNPTVNSQDVRVQVKIIHA